MKRTYATDEQVTEFKTRLTAAFKELRRLGYFVRQRFMCCQSCAWSAVPEGKGERVVFYHKQDADDIREGKDAPGVYLAWCGNGALIVSALLDAGLRAEWDGTEAQRIWVGLKTLVEIPEAELVSTFE